MATFADGEGGLSVRTKINNVLQHADGTAGELVINDAGADVDFRVESDTLTNALFVDGANGNVGIGNNAPAAKLDVTSGSLFLSQDYDIQWKAGTATRAAIRGTSADALVFSTRLGGTITDAMRIDTSGRLLIGTTTASGANLLQVNSDARINGLTVGMGSGALASNTAVGLNALVTNTTGASNTSVGGGALRLNTTGTYNVAVGEGALGANTTAAANTAVGYLGLFGNTTGQFNTAVGDGALSGNTTGSSNIAIGRGAGLNLTTGGSNTIIGSIAGTAGLANTVIIGAGSTERLRIDSNGNVGLGTSLNAWASYRVIQNYNSSFAAIDDNQFMLSQNCFYGPSSWNYINTNFASQYQQYQGRHQWWSAPSGTAGTTATFTQVMTLTQGGNLLLGTTSSSGARLDLLANTAGVFQGLNATNLSADAAAVSQIVIGSAAGEWKLSNVRTGGAFTVTAPSGTESLRVSSAGELIVGRITTDDSVQGFGWYNSRVNSTSASAAAALFNRQSTDGDIVLFRRANTGVGSISVTTSATAYNTSSDYRLKEDIQPVADATERLMELKPVNFAWKADGSRTDGFIAHEVQAVVPQAVTGEKDGDDMQQMDHSKLVPLLTAALQKAIQQIELLEARLDAANL